MKKTILFSLFVLTSFAALAIECVAPKPFCAKKASEMCPTEAPKFFGTDECVECGACPEGGTLIGETTCCKDGYKTGVPDHGFITYDTYNNSEQLNRRT